MPARQFLRTPIASAVAALLALAGSVPVIGPGVALAQWSSNGADEERAAGGTSLPSSPARGDPLTGPMDGGGDGASDLPPIIPSDDPTADRSDTDILDQRPGEGQRAVVRDGDLNYPPEPRAPVDGIVDVPEPDAVRDGIDPLSIDTRRREDIDAFENPPAGHDPLLFQIEDLPPVEDRRTQRLARMEPYDPIGMRIGSFVLFPEAELGGSWYSNVLRSQNPASDWALDFKPNARLVSDWQRHALEFRAGATLSYFSAFDSEDDRGYQLEARGRLDLTRRTNLQGFVAHDVSQESRSAIDANSAGERATLTVERAGATFNHRFNRLTLQLRGTVADNQYSDVRVGNTIQSNADRNHRVTEETLRASWEFKPTLAAFAEVGLNQRRYEAVAQSDGISRDSDGERYRLGLSFGNTGRILRGEVALGYGVQTPLTDRLEAISGIIVDANVAWRVTELTTLSFNARSDVRDTTTAGGSGVITRAFGVEARHAFMRQLIGTAGLTFSKNDYFGVDIDENEWRGDLGLEYHLSREAMLFGRYRHTDFRSSTPDGGYVSDEVHFGVRLRR